MENQLSLVVLAAGMGSRYGGLKQIDEFGPHGESLLEYAVYDALKAGFGHIAFVIREEFEQAFQEKFTAMLSACPSYTIVHQEFDPSFSLETTTREKPRGTLHATLSASDCVKGPFAVVNADDRYGTGSYALIAQRLKNIGSNESLLVGYVLGNTLSDHGTVNRGVCKVDGESLVDVVEHYSIGKHESGIQDKDGYSLTGEEIVSMNFRGFHQDFFDQAQPLFMNFVQEHAQEPRAEMVIPDAVDQLIHGADFHCTVLSSPDSRQGVTNPDDKPRVQQAFDLMIKDAVYPEHLWE